MLLSCDDNIKSYFVDVQYLKQRTANFSEGEKAVIFLINEVYTANRFKYQNGTFVGLTEDSACARTVLTFMVLSVCQSYKDVVCLVPLKTLDTNILHCWFDRMIKCLNKIFLVIAVFVDNRICNRCAILMISQCKFKHRRY